MATPSSDPRKKQNPSLPPKRGQIKARIFENFGEAFSFVASKAGEALSKIKGIGAGGGTEGGGGSSASTTPPRGSDTSGEYSDRA